MFQESAIIFTFAQTCSNLKFPLTLGISSGETEIISIDQDSSNSYLYMAGTTNTTELLVSGATKSVFITLFNGINYTWIKVINDPEVDTIEFMSAMGALSQNLVLYATKSTSPYIPVILTVSKSDGSIIRGVEINDSNIG